MSDNLNHAVKLYIGNEEYGCYAVVRWTSIKSKMYSNAWLRKIKLRSNGIYPFEKEVINDTH